MKGPWLILAALLALAGCRPPTSIPFALRPPGTGPALFATREVVFHLPMGGTERILATVENGPEVLAIVASTPMGQTLFSLRVRDGAVTLDARVPLPESFDPRLLPTLIQLSEWPLEEARKGLAPGMDLQEEGPLRTLTRRGKVLLTLARSGKAVRLHSPPLKLRVDITTLEEDPDPPGEPRP